MSASSTRMTKAHRVSIAGIAAAGVAAITLTLVPGGGSATAEAAPAKAAAAVPAAVNLEATAAKTASLQTGASAQKSAIETQIAQAAKAASVAQADAKAQADAAVKKAATEAAVKKAVAEQRAAEQPASRTVSATPRKPVYANNLDGWIREALDIMKKHNIPGSYDGLHRNIMRESSGNPRAINNWDINARNGIPSKGLLQVIQPTFDRYHVAGTPFDLYHPVSNIVAAANYAADRYGSIDNVFSAY
ncbi:transglycosylase SLT domain-containing protein [Streptomyces sp. NPDC004838]